MINMEDEQVTIKIRVATGCYHRQCSPEAYKIIDELLKGNHDLGVNFVEHESGPEIIVWVAAGVTLTTSVINLITAVINARAKGRERGDRPDGKLLLILRDTYRTDTSTEEIVLEIYDKDLVSNKQVKTAIEKGLKKRAPKVNSGITKAEKKSTGR